MITAGYWDQTYAEKQLIVNGVNSGRITYVPAVREHDELALKLILIK